MRPSDHACRGHYNTIIKIIAAFQRPINQACRGHCNTIIKLIAAFQNDVNQIETLINEVIMTDS